MIWYPTHRIRSGSFQVCKGRYRYEKAGDRTGRGCGGDGRASIWDVGWKCRAHHTQNEEAASLEGQQLMSARFLVSYLAPFVVRAVGRLIMHTVLMSIGTCPGSIRSRKLPGIRLLGLLV